MMDYLPNPFNEGYVTHTVSDDHFVRYFSPVLVMPAKAIYQPGNVVVRGTQGSGKSMLLRLLDPEVRIAYSIAERESSGVKEVKFPLSPDLCNFVSSRVDLNKSGLLDIVNTLPLNPGPEEIHQLAAAFGDFLNFWLLRGLFNSVDLICQRIEVFGNLVDAGKLNAFAKAFARQDCFFGSLDDVHDWDGLKTRIKVRVIDYRAWANGNRSLPDLVTGTRTSIGEPLARASEQLRANGVLNTNTSVFYIIDQLEALWMQDKHKREAGSRLRREIHQMMGSRDGRLSYRIGVRKYDWGREGNLAMRDGRELESGRDYQLIDIDELLRRNENATKWTFRALAKDVFRRRVRTTLANNEGVPSDLELSESFFGPSPEPAELVDELIKNPEPDGRRLLNLDDEWPEEWRNAILRCYRGEIHDLPSTTPRENRYDPLNALLLAAWGLQTGGSQKAGTKQRRFREKPPENKDQHPWDHAKLYWRKERYPQAVLQLASRHQQKLQWWGEAKILLLCGGNILRFITICRETWDYWQRLADDPLHQRTAGRYVETWIQARAAEEASRKIQEALRRQPGNPAGDVRIKFLDSVARWLRNKMLDDSAMSYPGLNGFSLRESDLDKHPALRELIREAVGWGDLYERPHTSKSKADEPRIKYYPNPALSPQYQLPEAHTKEPLYATAKDIETILQMAAKAGASVERKTEPSKPDDTNRTGQLPLFPETL